MDLSDLHIFRTVVSEGGVTRAATKLHRVQSNVTTRVRQLEDDLGVQLFIREGKRLHLSPSGQILLGYADRLLDLAAEAREMVQDATPRGLFRLGAMESTAAVRLPGPLSTYHRRYPDVTLELRTGNPQQLARAILDGEIDAALVAEPIADAPFEKLPIYNEELVIISAAGMPPIRSAQDVAGCALLAFEPGCPHRKRLEDWFGDQDVLPERLIEMGSYHAMLGCAAAGMGISLVPKIVLSTFPGRKQLTVHPLPPGQSHAQTVLIWRKGAGSPKIAALVEILKPTARITKAAGPSAIDPTRRSGRSC
jgi:DNA-binding transcriptional LysR family regulator